MQFDGGRLKILLVFHHTNQAASTAAAGSRVLTADGHIVLKVYRGLIICAATAEEEETLAEIALLDEGGAVAKEGDDLGGEFVPEKSVEERQKHVVSVGIIDQAFGRSAEFGGCRVGLREESGTS